jgi:hypothetical protein
MLELKNICFKRDNKKILDNVNLNLEDNKFILSTEYKADTEYFEKIDKEIGDIQEFSLHLPAIGNMVSDAWDIIHGPNRDDYRGDGENSSLKGRLDSFKDICFN